MNLTSQYIQKSRAILTAIEAQADAIQQAASWFSQTILAGRMVHLFGSGHSRIMVEEMWPRYGSFPGFNPIVELSLTFHNLVVGANGQRQAMFLENVPGLAQRILRNYDLSNQESALIISSSGCNVVPIEMAELFQQQGIKVVALITKQHAEKSTSKRPDGKKLSDFADLILDTGAPVGDAMVTVPGLDTPVAPGSTVGGAVLINCIKAEVARLLTEAGQPPKVLSAANVVGAEKAVTLFESAYDEHAHRLAKLYERVGIRSYVSEQSAALTSANLDKPLITVPNNPIIMKKRTFLKLSSTLLATPLLSPLASWVADEKLKNWAGNYQYSTDRLFPAKSIGQVQELVKKHPKLKVLGTRHCFNGIADSKDNLLSISAMDQVVALDTKANTVTVDASMSYGQLAPYLDKKGFALHNLASLPHISVAGACTTATHGSGVNNGNLATAVSALEIITASGDVRTISRAKDGDAFQAAVVHLGALGVVTRITLDVQPTFQMRQDVYENLPLDQLKDHFEAIVSGGYSVSLFTDWQKNRISEVWIKRRIDKDVTPEAKPDYFGATLATKNLHPIAELSAINCTEQMGVPGPWYERMPHFRMGFTPSSGKELQSEYFVPRTNSVDAILAVERLRDHISPHLMISEIRTIDEDNLWMSPCYKQASIAIHFTWKQDWDSVKKILPMIEKELASFKPKPHWGKLFTMAPSVLQSRYEKLPAFKQVVNEYDPKGKFRNDFLNTTCMVSENRPYRLFPVRYIPFL